MSDHFYVLYRGQLSKTVAGYVGESVLIPGASVGEDAVLAESKQPATITCKGLCVVLQFAVDQLFFIRNKLKQMSDAMGEEGVPHKRAPHVGQLKSALSFRVAYKAKANKWEPMSPAASMVPRSNVLAAGMKA